MKLRSVVAAALGAAGVWASLRCGAACAGEIDPRLARDAGAPAVARQVWVTFADKGATGAALAPLLAQAEAALTPRARARRLRAHVTPLVDAYDLPVCGRYLDSLAARGFAPHAVSRWLDRAAVWAPPARYAELAKLGFVARVSPVERGRVDFGPSGLARPAAPPWNGRAPRARQGAAATLDHGLLEHTLSQIGVPAMHDSGYVGTGVLIAILDDGFTGHDHHLALRGQQIAPGRQRDFVDGDTLVTNPADPFGRHGTLVMGLIAANLDGGYAGAAPGAEYALARTEIDDAEVHAEMLNWARAAEWADSLGADVISSSLGYSTFDYPEASYSYADLNGHTTTITRAAEIAASRGILVVNAAGNSGSQSWHYILAPADVNGDSLIAVGAVDDAGQPAGFSSYGPTADGRVKPDLTAPGVLVPTVSAFDTTGYDFSESGTSISTPLVAGLAACLLQARPQWTPRDVIRALAASASHPQRPDNRTGYGIPNGLRTLRGETPPSFTPRKRLDLVIEGADPIRPGTPARVVFGLDAGAVARPGRVRVFDVTGRAVRDLWSGTLLPGRPVEVTWDGTDDDRHTVASGLYWIAVRGNDDLAVARVTALK